MKLLLVILMAFSYSISSLAHDHGTNDHKAKEKMSKDGKNFGSAMKEQNVLTLDEVVNNFDKYEGKTVTIAAKAQKVCEKKGCWMVIKDGTREVRTMFKDYGFFVPKTILNKNVKVQGVMEKKKVSVSALRHYLKDAGASKEEIDKVKKPQVQFQFMADAVQIQ